MVEIHGSEVLEVPVEDSQEATDEVIEDVSDDPGEPDDNFNEEGASSPDEDENDESKPVIWTA